MADEEKNETTEEQTDAPEAAAPEAPAEEAPKEDAPAAEAAPADEAEADDAPAEEAPKEPSATADSPGGSAGEAEQPPEDVAPAEPAEDLEAGLDWKTRRRLAKSRESGEAGPQRSPEDRQSDRDKRRKAARSERSHYRKRARGKVTEKGTGTPPAEKTSVDRKVRQGTVVSSKPDKTITVRIDVARRHPVYEKVVRKTSTLHAHDEGNEAGDGDLVRIVETRPMSKLKRWRLEEILEKAK